MVLALIFSAVPDLSLVCPFFFVCFCFSNFCRSLAFSDEDGFLKVVLSGLNHSAFGGDSTIR